MTKVKFEAEFDNLTKLANRKSFIEYVDQRVASYANDSSYLVAWDIVNFRRINDIHGQGYADQVLVRLSEQLLLLTNHNQNKMGVGCSDYSMSRYGSNTFCAVLTSPTLDNAKALASLFRTRFFKAFQSSGFSSHIEVAMAVIPLTNNQHVKMWQKG
ncbi:diguanylate cyclase domain-containing protein [Vibrio variabilis]|uniref:diguanylate cyclase domain-containing protein n=1 Tax=Vibrio variabilis TaxID=990271 RepID=UPI0013A6E7AB|nr:diguanylate cyclase [Vibrio variabilis]